MQISPLQPSFMCNYRRKKHDHSLRRRWREHVLKVSKEVYSKKVLIKFFIYDIIDVK